MINAIRTAWKDRSYALLRIITGVLFAFHGVQKVFGVLTDRAPAVGSQMWIGGVIELVAGVMIAAGFFTVWAAFVASGTMAVAYIQFHWKMALDSKFFPVVNGGELAVIYCFLFLFIFFRGAGPWSIDEGRMKKKA